MRIKVFFASFFIFIVAILFGGWATTDTSLNPFSHSTDQTLYDMEDLPTAEAIILKLNHTLEVPRYDVGLFGNSRSEMVGRKELGHDECKFFNFSASGESIRNSLGMLEYLAALGKAPRLAIISFDHMEIEGMIGNPESLPLDAKLKFAFRDLTFVATNKLSLKDNFRLAARYARMTWKSMTTAVSSRWLLEGARRLQDWDWGKKPIQLSTVSGFRTDGSFVYGREPSVTSPSFKPTPYDQKISALLKNDLVRLKALEGKGRYGVEKIVIYESPLAPPFDRLYANAPQSLTASKRKEYLNACQTLGLTCLNPPPGSIEPDKNVWRDATHPPAIGLAKYIWRLIKDSEICDAMTEGTDKFERRPAL